MSTANEPNSPIHLTLDTIPLYFTYRDVVFGVGYVANVDLTGRVLCMREDDEYVMVGVEPGGLVAEGGSKAEVHQAFRNSYRAILFDIAASAPNPDAFRNEFERFVHETSPSVLADWELAVKVVRNSGPFDVDTVSAETPVTWRVSISRELAPQQNTIEEPAQHLMAA